jgi:negative regulator of flagellin synthesis FlgM
VKIEGTVKSVGGPPSGENRTRPSTKPGEASASGEKVELSSLSSSLNKAETAMANSPVVDRARVDEIRQAISEGRFKVDAGRVADGLIDSVRQMLDAQGGRP